VKGRAIIRLVVALLIVSSTTLVAGPALAQHEQPPFPCNPANLGSEFTDSMGIRWRCEYIVIETVDGTTVIYHWVPTGVTSKSLGVVSNDNNGVVLVVSGLDSNPDNAVVAVSNYKPDGTNKYQPVGELRIRTRIQYQAPRTGDWTDCRDSGFESNGNSASVLIQHVNMGEQPDCGDRDYRTLGHGGQFAEGVWKGGTVATQPCFRSMVLDRWHVPSRLRDCAR
jgi:hypothetical protein